MQRYAISYVSSAEFSLTEEQIESTLNFTQNWNKEHDITGILLYSDGNFFQVLEGEKELLLDLFSRIKNDHRHHNLITIFQKDVEGNNFSTYETDFISLDSRYDPENVENYFSQIELLNPKIQSSVKYILNKFTEGIK